MGDTFWATSDDLRCLIRKVTKLSCRVNTLESDATTTTSSTTSTTTIGTDQIVSTDTQSKYILTEPVNGTFQFNGTKLTKQISDRIPLYRMPSGNLTNQFDAMTFAGAMSTATITAVGGYDNVVVGNEPTPQSSYFRLTNRFFTASPIYVHMRIKVKALGATPVLGVRNLSAPAPYVNFINKEGYMYINLLTGAATSSMSGYPTFTASNGFTGAVVADEILDLYWEWTYNDTMKLRITKDKSGAEISSVFGTWGVNNNTSASIFYPTVIMADGTYQILSQEIGTITSVRPKIALIGDSLMSGARVSYVDTIVGKLESKLPYKIANFSSPATYLSGQQSVLKDLLFVKPEVAFISPTLEGLYLDYANPASPNYATYTAALLAFLNTLVNNGIKPVFLVASDTGLYVDSRMTTFETWIATNYPAALYVERLSTEGALDGTGIHLNGTANSIVADKLIALLEANNYL